MVLDVLAVVAGVAGVLGGGFLGWRLGVSSAPQVKQVVADVKAGDVVAAVKDAAPKA